MTKVHKKMPFVVQTELESVISIFDEAVNEHLRPLNPPILRVLWLSHVLAFLSFLHQLADDLISELNLTLEERRRLSTWYLDESIEVLHLCDIIHAEAESLQTRCLVLSTAVNLTRPLGSCSEDQILCVKDGLSGIDPEKSFYPRRLSPRRGKMEEAVEGLRHNLESLMGTKSKASAEVELLTPGTTARRILLGVGALTVMLTGLVASALTRSPMPVRLRMAPGEFRWSETFKAIERDVYRELRRKFGGEEGTELINDAEGVERHVMHVLKVMDDEVLVTVVVREMFRAKDRLEAALRQVKREENALFLKVVDIRNRHRQIILQI